MLTRITAITGLFTLAVQGAVLFGWAITQEQQAWLSAFVVAVGGVVHSWFNPKIPVGVKD